MTQREATIATIHAYYQAFDAQDMQAFFDLLSEGVAHDLNQGPREIGKTAFQAFMARMNRCYRERVLDLVVLASDDGTRASAEFVVSGTYLATDEGLPEARGQTYELQAGAFFEVKNGHVTRISNYYNLEDWLEQVRG